MWDLYDYVLCPLSVKALKEMPIFVLPITFNTTHCCLYIMLGLPFSSMNPQLFGLSAFNDSDSHTYCLGNQELFLLSLPSLPFRWLSCVTSTLSKHIPSDAVLSPLSSRSFWSFIPNERYAAITASSLGFRFTNHLLVGGSLSFSRIRRRYFLSSCMIETFFKKLSLRLGQLSWY